ncbi:NnrS family protein [Pseudomonas auratipiscis]|uniref:NnrS family protein n=1 Tax=Pseudomonas auratipiscis TaxID=3115853 RepID=A0AB35WV76_9PSED|nr:MULTISPECIES: NnrS family protein [unclassified Pseudomonas]MEE1868352.1 NnrS family protein [Pseudomonas sp. 120P]MEE1959830.1 NnrS family protein [Pseudomonas sp. 119P]
MSRSLPVLMCGFRPFFVLTAASATLLMLTWLLVINGWLPGWNPPGGLVLWHAHELIFGFAAAATAGFTLTAIPEFSKTSEILGKTLLPVVGLWLLARLAYLLAALWPAALGLWPAALCNLAFWLTLLRLLVPRLWQADGRAHLSFAWVILSLCLLQVGFFAAQLMVADALAWARAATGALSVLIVIATSRISMSVVNGRIEEGRPDAPLPNDSYLARPPRRNLAIVCIVLCSASEFVIGGQPVSGWVALAAAAAMFNLLNDWHVGRPLFQRWALMLYTCYWLIGLGYLALGAAWLGAPISSSSGRHLLTSGAVSLAIFAVMAMVGRIHAGLWLDRRPWPMLCASTLVLAALLRTLAGLPLTASSSLALMNIAGLLWASCFAIYLIATWNTLTGPRADGRHDGSGPQLKSDHSC